MPASPNTPSPILESRVSLSSLGTPPEKPSLQSRIQPAQPTSPQAIPRPVGESSMFPPTAAPHQQTTPKPVQQPSAAPKVDASAAAGAEPNQQTSMVPLEKLAPEVPPSARVLAAHEQTSPKPVEKPCSAHQVQTTPPTSPKEVGKPSPHEVQASVGTARNQQTSPTPVEEPSAAHTVLATVPNQQASPRPVEEPSPAHPVLATVPDQQASPTPVDKPFPAHLVPATVPNQQASPRPVEEPSPAHLVLATASSQQASPRPVEEPSVAVSVPNQHAPVATRQADEQLAAPAALVSSVNVLALPTLPSPAAAAVVTQQASPRPVEKLAPEVPSSASKISDAEAPLRISRQPVVPAGSQSLEAKPDPFKSKGKRKGSEDTLDGMTIYDDGTYWKNLACMNC